MSAGRGVTGDLRCGRRRRHAPAHEGILSGSPSGFLEQFAAFYAFLADLRNCPGVMPSRRLK